MATSPESTSKFSIYQRFMGCMTRVNQSAFVQNFYVYLNSFVFLAQIASMIYFIWEWTKQSFPPQEEENCDEVVVEDLGQEEVNTALLKSMSNLLIYNEIRDPIKRNKERQQLIEDERHEALLQEQQEAWILKITGKDF